VQPRYVHPRDVPLRLRLSAQRERVGSAFRWSLRAVICQQHAAPPAGYRVRSHPSRYPRKTVQAHSTVPLRLPAGEPGRPHRRLENP
jgi:hypothetical protein